MSARIESTVIIANKNKLISASLKSAIESGRNYNVIVTESGKDLLRKMKSLKPSVVILDIQLKDTNAYDLIREINKNISHRSKVLILSSFTHPYTVNYMLKYGAAGYLPLDSDMRLLLKVIAEVATNKQHYNKLAPKSLVSAILGNEINVPELSNKQINFLQYCCTDLPYAEMAVNMEVSLRTVDWYRDVMFDTFKLNNRTDLVLFALRTGLVEL